MLPREYLGQKAGYWHSNVFAKIEAQWLRIMFKWSKVFEAFLSLSTVASRSVYWSVLKTLIRTNTMKSLTNKAMLGRETDNTETSNQIDFSVAS